MIGFEQGTPVSVNGERLGGVDLIAALNAIGGKHGVGVVDLVEDRMVGMKSRGVYETPGGSLLYAAHSELEQLVLDRKTLAAKDLIAPRYADLVYEGRWWTTEREAYDAFVDVTQERVTGYGHPAPVQGLDRRRRPRERARAVRRALRHVRRGRRLPAERRRRLHSAVRSAGARPRDQGSGDGLAAGRAGIDPRTVRRRERPSEPTLADRVTTAAFGTAPTCRTSSGAAASPAALPRSSMR